MLSILFLVVFMLFHITCCSNIWACDFRYDGQRAQIHKLADGSFRVFSRNGDESTSRFPDLINIMKESCKPGAVTFILDAEVRTYGTAEVHMYMCATWFEYCFSLLGEVISFSFFKFIFQMGLE